MTLPLPEKIEVKLAFVSEDTAKAFAILGLSDPLKEETSRWILTGST